TTLALLVGVLQLGAGLFGLATLVDYISGPVVLGYITGAAVLIGGNQAANATATQRSSGSLLPMLRGWIEGLGQASPVAMAFAAGTIGVIVGIRRMDPRVPGAILAMIASIVLSETLGLRKAGLRVVSDVAPIPAGFPPLTLPRLDQTGPLLPLAAACA